MSDEVIKCPHHEEFIDRLIDNDFHFKVQENTINNVMGEEGCPSVTYTLIIPTYMYREETWNSVGFHYYGKQITMSYYKDFDDMEDVYELIREAIYVMKIYMKNEVAKKLKDIIVHHLGVE